MSSGDTWLRPPDSQRRFGVKGPRAADLLRQLDLAVPDLPNHWSPLREHDESWDVIARLGSTEFFIDESGDARGIAALEKLTGEGIPGAYAVLREDFAVILGGPLAHDVLAQVCNVNFAALPEHAVVMTLMIGVAVLVMPRETAGGRVYRIWCDPSFGSYLKSELEQMVNQ
jgi:sarcosine oxidase subunit gamma